MEVVGMAWRLHKSYNIEQLDLNIFHTSTQKCAGQLWRLVFGKCIPSMPVLSLVLPLDDVPEADCEPSPY